MVKKIKSPAKKVLPAGKKTEAKAVKRQAAPVPAEKGILKQSSVLGQKITPQTVPAPVFKAALKPVFVPIVKVEPVAVVKSAVTVLPRKTVITTETIVNDDHLFALIQAKAYELFAARDFSAGSDLGDWYKAEIMVKKELRLN